MSRLTIEEEWLDETFVFAYWLTIERDYLEALIAWFWNTP